VDVVRAIKDWLCINRPVDFRVGDLVYRSQLQVVMISNYHMEAKGGVVVWLIDFDRHLLCSIIKINLFKVTNIYVNVRD